MFQKKNLLSLVIIVTLILVGFLIYLKPKPPVAQIQTSWKQTLFQTKNLDAKIQAIIKIVDTKDPLAALNELNSQMKTDKEIFKNCHGIAHEIGHRAYDKYKNFAEAMKYQNVVCSDGYLHGVIEQRFFYAKNPEAILSDMKTVCDGVKESGRCYHGVGHGLMYYFANDLPKVLDVCDKYKNAAQGRCYEGAFMENFLSDAVIHPSVYLDSKNSLYPCPTELSRYKSYCYFYAPIYYLSLHSNYYAAALEWCTTAEKVGVPECIRGVGSLAMKYNIDQPKAVEAICNRAKNKQQTSSCIDGMVSYYLTFYDHLSKAIDMCATMELKNQPACNAAVDRRSKLFLN